jgi:hypothetical protein
MLPPPRPGTTGENGAAVVDEDGDVVALQSAASLTSPAMSTRVRDDMQEDSMVDSQGFGTSSLLSQHLRSSPLNSFSPRTEGNLRIAHSDMSITTAETSANPSSRDPLQQLQPHPAVAIPLPPLNPLNPLPSSTENMSTSNSDSPQLAGTKRKTMASHFSDSSLSELPSQPSQDYREGPAVHGVDFGQRGREMSGVVEEKEDGDDDEEEEKQQDRKDDAAEETDEPEPSTTEEVDVVPERIIKPQPSPRTTRRSSRGGATASPAPVAAATPARKKVVTSTPIRRSARGSVGGGGRRSSVAASNESAASASPEATRGADGEDNDGGIAAAVKSRRRKAAKLS